MTREEVVQAALTVERYCRENFEKNKNGKCDFPFCKPPYDEDLCRFWPFYMIERNGDGTGRIYFGDGGKHDD